MTADTTFRQPGLGDAAPITRLVHNSPPLDANSHYLYLLLCKDFADTCLVAQNGYGIVGFVSAYRPPSRPHCLFIWQVAVAAAMRGRGLAKQMMLELLQRDQCTGARHIETTVSPSNLASLALFRSLAVDLNAQCTISPLFDATLFAGVDDQHESEDLIRIGPLAVPATP